MSADIQALYAEWLSKINASELSEREMEAVSDEIAAIERKLAVAHAVTARDLLTKAKIADHYVRTGWVYEEERDMLKSMIRDLRRLGGAP